MLRKREYCAVIRRAWCKLFHRRDLTPIHGRVVCATCLLERPVPWADAQESRAHQVPEEIIIDWPILEVDDD